ncbi:MAG: hypothetical protein JNL05_11805 [Flavobacteriales bacterium]|nr:hypothetical protein [Flavobacteriales bacterium]
MNTADLRCGILGAVFLLSACTTNRINGPGTRDTVQLPRTGVLHLHATYTAPYCGGADPGPEGMPRPEPWSGAMFLRPAKPDSTGAMARNELSVPVADTIRTDRTGNGYRTLKAGTYLLLDADRVNDTRYQQLLRDHAKPALYTEPIDKACLDRWLHGPFGVITVRGGDTTHVDLPLFDQCPWYNTPCVHYHGPLPP